MSHWNPRDLGMDRRISRRDFFDGVAVAAVAGSLLGPGSSGRNPAGAAPTAPTAPVAVTGGPCAAPLGDTAQALSVPHALRDGRFWEYAGRPEDTGERYDLVVVGGGLSGMSAAFAWLRAEPGARVLVLDAHDELKTPSPDAAGRGSALLDPPSAWTREGRALLDDLGVGLERAAPASRQADSVMCDRETFPVETLVRLTPGLPAERLAARLPVADAARRDLVMLCENPPDWFPGLPAREKQERLAGLTYSDFLLRVCRVHPDVERFLRTLPNARWGCSTRCLGAIDAWASRGYPGFQGLGLDRSEPSRFNSPTVEREWNRELYRVRGGEESLVRAMTRAVAGDGGPGRTGQQVRLRPSSPVVSVRNDGDPGSASSATVAYFDGHRVLAVGAGSVILACQGAMVPYLVPELPERRREALRRAVRLPLLDAAVRVRDRGAWRRLGVSRTRWTGAYWCVTELEDGGPENGGAEDGGGPGVVRLLATPCRSELGPDEGAAAGRRALLRTPYAHMEFTVREQLARLLGPAGFDPARDIESIAVHRWGHGRAPEYRRPWHSFAPDGPFPSDAARGRFGRIAVAGSDAVPWTGPEAAVTAALRAVEELRR